MTSSCQSNRLAGGASVRTPATSAGTAATAATIFSNWRRDDRVLPSIPPVIVATGEWSERIRNSPGGLRLVRGGDGADRHRHRADARPDPALAHGDKRR